MQAKSARRQIFECWAMARSHASNPVRPNQTWMKAVIVKKILAKEAEATMGIELM
jgi:hypothetical protein